jgi:hypothetical protein
MLKNIVTIFILLLPHVAFAGWDGPKIIVTGTWGSKLEQFHMYEEASGEDIPQKFAMDFSVDKDGNIVIPDLENRRIVIYDKAGHLIKVLTKPVQLPALDEKNGWPGSLESYEGGNSIVIPCRYEKKEKSGGTGPSRKCFLDYNGKILAEVPMAYTGPIQTGYILRTKDRSYLYSPTGKMLEERPAALINRSYHEDEYGGFTEYKSSSNFNKCSKELNSLSLPDSQWKESNGLDGEKELVADYGGRVVTSNCNVYLWKRTPTAFSILRWTWIDEQMKNTKQYSEKDRSK